MNLNEPNDFTSSYMIQFEPMNIWIVKTKT